ncbi:MAG: hypothetical protein OXH85_11005 [Truepera sp.]|nr:hypothetical protein [Truepera sp.]
MIKEGGLESKGEKLLQDLVSHERELVAKVEEAQDQAAAILAEARAEAEAIMTGAYEEAEAAAKAQEERTRLEAEGIREEILKTARTEVSRIEAQAKANRNEAVRGVVERVLP